MAFFSMTKVLLLCTISLSLLLTTPVSVQSSNYLLSGERLNTDDSLTEGIYRFTMQSDCNLVLYRLSIPKWASNTYNQGSECYLQFHRDASLIIYDKENKILWEIGTQGTEGTSILIVQRDGKVVIYGPNIWSTETDAYGSKNAVVATALNETMRVSGKEQNKVRKVGKIMDVVGDE